MSADFHLTEDDVAAFQSHPDFRRAVDAWARADLARYRSLSPDARWLVRDVGRASLSGTVMALNAMGKLTAAGLMASQPVATGEVSRGRARLYLHRAVETGMIATAVAGEPLRGSTRLSATDRFLDTMWGLLRVIVRSAAGLSADLAPALSRLEDRGFMQAVSVNIGQTVKANLAMFPLDRPVQLFQARDGGSRLLWRLIVGQAPGRARMLEACACSNSALAASSLCSRAHVNALLKDGEARSLLWRDGPLIRAAPELSDDVERYCAQTFAVARRAALA